MKILLEISGRISILKRPKQSCLADKLGSIDLIVLLLVATCLAAMQLTLLRLSYYPQQFTKSAQVDPQEGSSLFFNLIDPRLGAENLTPVIPDLINY